MREEGHGAASDAGRAGAAVIAFRASVHRRLAVGQIDMRREMTGLALQVQEELGRDPHGIDLYVFRGARGDLIKILPVYALFSASLSWHIS